MASAAPASATSAAPADLAGTDTPLTFHALTLRNGWHSEENAYGTGDPAVARSADGIVYLRGSLAGGTSPVAFVVPKKDRPAHTTDVPVYTYGGSIGMLRVEENGFVEAEGDHAVPFSSLAGVSFPSAHASLTWQHLDLVDGWHSAAGQVGAGVPAVSRSAEGIVYYEGALAGGNTGKSQSFAIPTAFQAPSPRPVWHPVATAGGSAGSFYGHGDTGLVFGTQAATYTSLGGLSYPSAKATKRGLVFSKATLTNGWKPGIAGWGPTGKVGALRSPEGVVHLEGVIHGGAIGESAFTLPPQDRPTNTLYISVYTNGGTVGDLDILPNGQVIVYGTSASTVTSLGGVSFTVWS